VSIKEDMFSKEGGHKSQEKFSVIFGPSYFSAVEGRTVRIRTVRTIPYSLYNCMDLAQKSRQIWAQFSRQISDFCSLFLGHTEQYVQLTVGMENEVWSRLYRSTVLAQKTRQNLVGLFWCCEVFSLAGNVYVLLFCTFLKLNNNLSLSLSHWVSPHWGFPWHLPKFLSVMGCCPLCYFRCYFS
jgi:hypothetical protein